MVAVVQIAACPTREARAVTHRLALNGQVIISLDPSTVPGPV